MGCPGIRERRKFRHNPPVFSEFFQDGFVVMKRYRVIHVADITFSPEPFLHKMVKGVKIDIREKLAGKVANRYSRAVNADVADDSFNLSSK